MSSQQTKDRKHNDLHKPNIYLTEAGAVDEVLEVFELFDVALDTESEDRHPELDSSDDSNGSLQDDTELDEVYCELLNRESNFASSTSDRSSTLSSFRVLLPPPTAAAAPAPEMLLPPPASPLG